MMSQHSNSLVAATVAHNENLLRLCTIMAAVSMAKDACKCSIVSLFVGVALVVCIV